MATTKPKSAATAYDAEKTYTFRLMRSVRIMGCRYGRADEHTAKGALINAIISQEGADVVDNADPRE